MVNRFNTLYVRITEAFLSFFVVRLNDLAYK